MKIFWCVVFFFYFSSKHRLWVMLEIEAVKTSSHNQTLIVDSNEYPQSIF